MCINGSASTALREPSSKMDTRRRMAVSYGYEQYDIAIRRHILLETVREGDGTVAYRGGAAATALVAESSWHECWYKALK